jgi:hypothetical protein
VNGSPEYLKLAGDLATACLCELDYLTKTNFRKGGRVGAPSTSSASAGKSSLAELLGAPFVTMAIHGTITIS